jgi:serine phosphatase RsbU (regulator of sigma subunit)
LVIHPQADAEAIASLAEPGRDVQYLPSPFNPSVFLVKVATLLRLRKFTNEQVSFETQIAAQNAELRDLTNRFKQELKEARSIQQSILPKKLPVAKKAVFAACFMPLEAVGGDMFDIWKIDDSRFGLFIGDVTGHGLAAAFIGAMTKMSLEYAPKQDPATMLEHMNNGLADLLPEGRFVTVAAAFYDDSSGKLQIARGGHPPPLVWQKSLGKVLQCSPRGLPLGVAPMCKYECQEVTLCAGDKVLFVTDGLTETSDMDGKMLGVDGAAQMYSQFASDLSIDKCLKAVLDGQKTFSGGRLTKDDNTLLGLERL